MELMHISLLLLLAAMQLHVAIGIAVDIPRDRIISGRDRIISGRDRITARDIRHECCKQRWRYCCKAYSQNISAEDKATDPPLPRSDRNPKCTLAKARRERSQALQCTTMFDILIAIQTEYHTIRELELCVPTVNKVDRKELIRKLTLRRNSLEINTASCCAMHLYNHTARKDEIIEKFHNFTAVKQQLRNINRICSHHGHSGTIKTLFSEALHRLGQQLKGLECLEALSSKPNFCRDDICIREKSVQKCIDQRL